MKAVFLADAHLKKSSDERYEKLMSFLNDLKEGKVCSLIGKNKKNNQAVYIDDIFIAGDLFDFWFCRKENIYPEFRPIIDKLIDLKQAGVKVHLLEGNHDFFMKEYFGDVHGMEVCDEWLDRDIDSRKFLIGHGDTADQSNKVYLFFRKVLRSRFFYLFQRFLPRPLLWSIASLSSAASKELNKDNGDALFEKMSSFAEVKLRDGYDVIIMGHSHQPLIRRFNIIGKEKIFIALGDWIKYYSFVYYEDGNFSLSHYHPRVQEAGKINQHWT